MMDVICMNCKSKPAVWLYLHPITLTMYGKDFHAAGEFQPLTYTDAVNRGWASYICNDCRREIEAIPVTEDQENTEQKELS
jgi:DNA-directed RNA polymerase subunit RPC12/RpoP